MLKRIITICAGAACLGALSPSALAAPSWIPFISTDTKPGTLNQPLTDASGNALPTSGRVIPIPRHARRADMVFDGTTTIKVNGKTATLAPGARIYGPDNMLRLSTSLVGTAKTKFLLEPQTGMLLQIWILTLQEIATPDPAPTDDDTTTTTTGTSTSR